MLYRKINRASSHLMQLCFKKSTWISLHAVGSGEHSSSSFQNQRDVLHLITLYNRQTLLGYSYLYVDEEDDATRRRFRNHQEAARRAQTWGEREGEKNWILITDNIVFHKISWDSYGISARSSWWRSCVILAVRVEITVTTRILDLETNSCVVYAHEY